MRRTGLVLLCAALVLPAVAVADHHEQPAYSGDAARADYLMVYDDAAKKLESLAAEFPADKMDWRPAEGVRSVAEAFQHVSGAVYFLTGLMKVEAPEGAPATYEEMEAFEKNSDKAVVLAELEKALAFGRQTAENATPELLSEKFDFFGSEVSGRGMLLILHAHMTEHLGQTIAYARSTGVVPPWSQPQEDEESGD